MEQVGQAEETHGGQSGGSRKHAVTAAEGRPPDDAATLLSSVAAVPYRVYLGLCPVAGAVCRSGCVRSFARLEDAERFAVEVLSRCPPPAPGGDRFAEVRRVGAGGDVLVRHISWGG